ncbi:hypothetical protein [Verrucomicrobium spinosum]|uniref:hypothetical protein n=1 Tax=Verrucomicrobium spinosum TaxID=2736 RepID=UPI00017466B6|nr:hypothetical protein [Verrucomicrobium spinosum]
MSDKTTARRRPKRWNPKALFALVLAFIFIALAVLPYLGDPVRLALIAGALQLFFVFVKHSR